MKKAQVSGVTRRWSFNWPLARVNCRFCPATTLKTKWQLPQISCDFHSKTTWRVTQGNHRPTRKLKFLQQNLKRMFKVQSSILCTMEVQTAINSTSLPSTALKSQETRTDATIKYSNNSKRRNNNILMGLATLKTGLGSGSQSQSIKLSNEYRFEEVLMHRWMTWQQVVR